MQDQVNVEVVLFKLGNGVKQEEFIEAMARATDFLSQCEGFISRELLYSAESEQWIDTVRWTSKAAAFKAAELFMREPATQTLLAMFDQPSLTMLHLQVVKGV